MEHATNYAEPVNDDVRLIRLIRDKPDSSMSEWAKDMGWVMPNGAPYHVKIARAIKRMESNGFIKRDAMGNYTPIDDAESRVGGWHVVGPIPIAPAEYLALYEYLRVHPTTNLSDAARDLGWLMSDGRPYVVKVHRAIDRLTKAGHIKREVWTGQYSLSRRRNRSYRYTLVCAPIPENHTQLGAAMAPVRKAGIVVHRTIHTVADALGLIRHVASIASQLSKESPNAS